MYVMKKLASLRGGRREGNMEMEGSRMTPSFWFEQKQEEKQILVGGGVLSSGHIGLRNPQISRWRCSVGSWIWDLGLLGRLT